MDYLINVFGKDQPGLVAGITEIFYRHDANLGDANMTRLGEAFALIMMVSVDEGSEETVREELEAFVEDSNLVTSMVPREGFRGKWGSVRSNTIISVYGADQPGIVHRITDRLAEDRINICDLQSSLSSKADLYIMVLEVHRPENMTLDELAEQMETLSEELDVNVQVGDLESSPL